MSIPEVANSVSTHRKGDNTDFGGTGHVRSSAGRRLWVLVNPETTVQLRITALGDGATRARRAIPQSASCPLNTFRWAEDIGLSVIGSTPVSPTKPGSSSVGRASRVNLVHREKDHL